MSQSQKQGPPDRSFNLQVPISSAPSISPVVAQAVAAALAEAQMLEHAIKRAIGNDVVAFAPASDAKSLIAALRRVTLGEARMIAERRSRNSKHEGVQRLIEFGKYIGSLWSEPRAMAAALEDAITRRNLIAHSLLAELAMTPRTEVDLVCFLSSSRDLFHRLRITFEAADFLSAKMGAVSPTGKSLARFRETSAAAPAKRRNRR